MSEVRDQTIRRPWITSAPLVSNRNSHFNPQPLFRKITKHDITPMSPEHLTNDSQPQAGSARFPSARSLNTVKRLERRFEFVLGNTRPVVLHAQKDALEICGESDAGTATIFEGVIDKIA